jgi:hypothetical protein
MRSALRAAVGVSSLLQSAPAHAREMIRLPPSSKWVLDYAEENCRLARSFGTGDQQVNLVLDQFAPGDWFRVTLSGRPLTLSNLKIPSKPLLRFGPNEKPSEADGFAALIGKVPAFITSSSLRLAPFTEAETKASENAFRSGQIFDPETIGQAREAATKWIELTDLLRSADITLEVGPLDKAFEALRQCSWDTVRSWGLDVAQQKSLSRKPKAKRTAVSWFSPDDYPSKMLDENKQAVVNFRVIVDEKGAPASCTIQRSTRPKDFDDLVCRLIMKRAKFEPALDASGNPVRSFYTQRVTWRLQ